MEGELVPRLLLEQAVSRHGHDVRAFGDAESAIQTLQTEMFPLILTDWNLPGMDGLEFCRQIRSLPNGGQPVILMIAGRHEPEDLNKVLDAGASDFLTKPLDTDLLDMRLRIAERRAEESLRRLKVEQSFLKGQDNLIGLSMTLCSIGDALVESDLDGQVVRTNPEATRLTGWSEDQARGETLARVFQVRETGCPDDTMSVNGWICAEGKAVRFGRNARLVGRDGNETPIACTGAPVRDSCGVIIGQVFVFRDLSEEKRLETQLRLSERMVSIGTLAAGVAHELNNPLAYISANIDFVLEQLPEMALLHPHADLQDLKDPLLESRQGVDRVRRIVRDLKTFSRPADEKLHPVDVRQVLESTINMAWNEIRHRARLVKLFETKLPVFANEARLCQVFLNIIVNAAQSIKEGDAQENEIRIRTFEQDGKVGIEIKDTGCGIPSHNLSKIFDPFYTTKPVGIGTGLGLAISHQIVSAFAGTISVESVVGKGTTFTISFPAAVEAVCPDTQTIAPVTKQQEKAARVLVVDDEIGITNALRRSLRGHDVTVVDSGRAAIEACRNTSFDLVFCDVMMADLTGIDVWEHLKKNQPGYERKIVFMTGGAFTGPTTKFLANVSNEVVEKPFDVNRIRSIANRVAEARQETACEKKTG